MGQRQETLLIMLDWSATLDTFGSSNAVTQTVQKLWTPRRDPVMEEILPSQLIATSGNWPVYVSTTRTDSDNTPSCHSLFIMVVGFNLDVGKRCAPETIRYSSPPHISTKKSLKPAQPPANKSILLTLERIPDPNPLQRVTQPIRNCAKA